MQIIDVAKKKSKEERLKDRYHKVISLADEVFGRERISGHGRGIASMENSGNCITNCPECQEPCFKF